MQKLKSGIWLSGTFAVVTSVALVACDSVLPKGKGTLNQSLSSAKIVKDAAVQTAQQVLAAGARAISSEVTSELTVSLVSAGLTNDQAVVIASSGQDEAAAAVGVIAIETGLHLDDVQPIEVVAAPIVKGAIAAMQKPAAGLNDDNDLKLKITKAIMSSTFNSLGGRVSGLAKGNLLAMQKDMVGTAVKTLGAGGLGGDLAAGGVNAITSGAVESLASSTPAEDAASTASGMAQSTVSNLGSLGLSTDQVVNATESAANGTVSSLVRAGVALADVGDAAQQVAAGSVNGLKEAGVGSDDVGSAAGAIAAGAIAGLQNNGLSSAQIVAANTISKVVSGAVGALASTGIASDKLGDAIGQVAGKSVAAVGKNLGSAADKQSALADVISGSVSSSTAAGIADVQSLAAMMTSVSKKSVEAMSTNSGFAAADVANAAALITKTGMTAAGALGTASGSDMVVVAQKTAEGAASGCATLAGNGSIDSTQLSQSANAISSHATDAFVTLTSKGSLSTSDAANFLGSIGQSTMTGLAIGGASTATITSIKTSVDQTLTNTTMLSKIGVDEATKAQVTTSVTSATASGVTVAKQIINGTMQNCSTAFPDSETDAHIAPRLDTLFKTGPVFCKVANVAAACPKNRGDSKGGVKWLASGLMCQAVPLGKGSNNNINNIGPVAIAVVPCSTVVNAAGKIGYLSIDKLTKQADNSNNGNSGTSLMCDPAPTASVCPMIEDQSQGMQVLSGPDRQLMTNANSTTLRCYYHQNLANCKTIMGTATSLTNAILENPGTYVTDFGNVACFVAPGATCPSRASDALANYDSAPFPSPATSLTQQCTYLRKYNDCPSSFSSTTDIIGMQYAFKNPQKRVCVATPANSSTFLPPGIPSDFGASIYRFQDYLPYIVFEYGAPTCVLSPTGTTTLSDTSLSSLPFQVQSWSRVCDVLGTPSGFPNCPSLQSGSGFTESDFAPTDLGVKRCFYSSKSVAACPGSMSTADFSPTGNLARMDLNRSRGFACTNANSCEYINYPDFSNAGISGFMKGDPSFGLTDRCTFQASEPMCSTLLDQSGHVSRFDLMASLSENVWGCDSPTSACPDLDSHYGDLEMVPLDFTASTGFTRCLAMPKNIGNCDPNQPTNAIISSYASGPSWQPGTRMCSVSNSSCPTPDNLTDFQIDNRGPLTYIAGKQYCVYRPAFNIAPAQALSVDSGSNLLNVNHGNTDSYDVKFYKDMNCTADLRTVIPNQSGNAVTLDGSVPYGSLFIRFVSRRADHSSEVTNSSNCFGMQYDPPGTGYVWPAHSTVVVNDASSHSAVSMANVGDSLEFVAHIRDGSNADLNGRTLTARFSDGLHVVQGPMTSEGSGIYRFTFSVPSGTSGAAFNATVQADDLGGDLVDGSRIVSIN